jgi:hypothetical protein
MKKVRSFRSAFLIVFLISILGYSLSPVSAAETGIPDAKPTPSAASCGSIVCSYLLGKYFVFGGVDNKTSGDFGDIGQFPCQVDGNSGTNFCRVFPKNAVPSNNLNKVVLKGGYVEVGQAFTCEVSPTDVCKPNPLLEMKIVLTGEGAKFDLFPYVGFTFSQDRKTLYIAKDATFVESNYQLPKIIANQIGTIEVTAFLAVSPGEYSSTQVESGKILVVSKNDNFIFQRLTQQDLKKNPKLKIKPMQREITCAKGKSIKKVLKTNIYDIKCPTGYKIS